jgi:hypothetical protein
VEDNCSQQLECCATFDMFGSMIAHYQAYILQQEDIRNHIDSSVKRGYDLSTFRKERIGGDSLGISYWWVKKILPFFG